MAVSKEPKAAPATEVAQEDSPQSIALRLFRVKRYIRYGDPQVYEAGNVYEFDLAVGHQRLKETDPEGFPIFTIHKAEDVKPAPAPVTRAPAAKRVVVPAAPAKSNTPALDEALKVLDGPTKVSKIEIQDDDPELEERLANIDKGEDGAVAV